MTQTEVERLKAELRQRELAATTTLIEGARAVADRADGAVRALVTDVRLLEQRLGSKITEYDLALKAVNDKLASMNQSKLAMFGTIGAAGITTIANVVIALVRDR